jgi:hypothetical protein
MSGQTENLTRWALDLARRASSEQSRLVRNYGFALRRSFGPMRTVGDPVTDLLKFGLSEFEILSRGSLVASLLYCDALVTSLQRSNERFENSVLKVDNEINEDNSQQNT